MFAQLAGEFITDVNNLEELAGAWVLYLGMPSDLDVKGWQLFKAPAAIALQAWNRRTRLGLGPSGMKLLRDLLMYSPKLRPSCREALEHRYFKTQSFALLGVPVYATRLPTEKDPAASILAPAVAMRDAEPTDVTTFSGSRHDWNMHSGNMSPEVLWWLREDRCFNVASPQHSIVADVWARRNTSRGKVEENRKIIVSGSVGSTCTSSMCGLDIKQPLPIPRVCAWVKAFKHVNRASLVLLDAQAKRGVMKLGKRRYGPNGTHFLKTPVDDWFLTCGELVMVDPGSECKGFWCKPKHQDGGMSVLHMG